MSGVPETLALRLRVPQLIAIVAVIVLHVAVFVLMPAHAPRIGSDTNDAAITLIVIPAVTQPPVDVSDRPTPAAMRSQERVVSAPPTMPAEEGPPLTEREPIDFAREAALATQRAVASIELERRRARGFTPDAQNREPEVVRKPAPEFGWASTAQPVEVLPGGGILVQLSEHCVVAVTFVAFAACGIGKIPVNGKLFEHMNDAPTLGDWKDDSALLP